MQIKELKYVLNGQCEIIGFTLEEVDSMMCDICVDILILTYGVFNLWCFFHFLIYNKNCKYILYSIVIWRFMHMWMNKMIYHNMIVSFQEVIKTEVTYISGHYVDIWKQFIRQ